MLTSYLHKTAILFKLVTQQLYKATKGIKSLVAHVNKQDGMGVGS
jgi:hypothetical protein